MRAHAPHLRGKPRPAADSGTESGLHGDEQSGRMFTFSAPASVEAERVKCRTLYGDERPSAFALFPTEGKPVQCCSPF